MTTEHEPRIAVVGAGLGGLACAKVLQSHGRRATVFEREPSADARGQGGTLDMHADTGQFALRAAGLFDEFQALARPEGQEWRSYDHNAVLLSKMDADNRPEIDRGHLRGIYLNSLDPGTIHWGHSISAVTPLDDGTSRLRFADGTTKDFDLVVGADGAWSRVRPAISAGTPDYTGITFVETGFDEVDTCHPDLARLTGNGTMVAKGPGLGIFAQRNSGGRIKVYLVFRGPANWAELAGLDLADTAAVRAHLLGRYDGWDERLLDLLRTNDSGFIDRPQYALPVPHTWHRAPGITLLGDAAHLMPPLGLGANLAMLDGTELANAIVDEPTIDEAVRAYETVMLPRSAEAAEACGEGLQTLLPA
ncbi:MAG TPA: NAD(P)/FAD-dependent oxidoreductase [Pseudonocardiaceae bacterium]|jgi:2-polyprenyl-6-methoxyphenol hydroxylase-like FAD-dependent oxidoreductase|nr:NAD(P)/FAD-dependent oxidoreductase [Pseudonocardiaceae bacterium]